MVVKHESQERQPIALHHSGKVFTIHIHVTSCFSSVKYISPSLGNISQNLNVLIVTCLNPNETTESDFLNYYVVAVFFQPNYRVKEISTQSITIQAICLEWADLPLHYTIPIYVFPCNMRFLQAMSFSPSSISILHSFCPIPR